MEQKASVEWKLTSYPQGSVPFEPLDMELNRLFFSNDEWKMVQKGLNLLRSQHQKQLKDTLIQLELSEESGHTTGCKISTKRIKTLKKKLKKVDELIADIEQCAMKGCRH